MELSGSELREHIIHPALLAIGQYSSAAENLLLARARLEQQQHIRLDTVSNPHPTGFGLYQISAAEHRRIWDKYLAFEPELASKIRGLASQRAFLDNPHIELESNLRYATAIAWALFIGQHLQVIHPQDQSQISLARADSSSSTPA